MPVVDQVEAFWLDEHILTVEQARDDYGVVVAPDGAIDRSATEKLRAGA